MCVSIVLTSLSSCVREQIAVLAEIACGLMSVQVLHTEESLSLIHSLPTSPATLATPQSVAGIVGCDRAWHEVRMRSLIYPSCEEIVRSLLLSRDAIGDVRKGDRSWKAS